MDKCRFELLNSFDSAPQTCLGIDCQVHVQRMALLIGDDFRVDVLSAHECGMGSPPHLKIDPTQADRFQLRANVPAPYAIFG